VFTVAAKKKEETKGHSVPVQNPRKMHWITNPKCKQSWETKHTAFQISRQPRDDSEGYIGIEPVHKLSRRKEIYPYTKN
jgi:hypothetical protein